MEQYEARQENQEIFLPLAKSEVLTGQPSARDDTCFAKTTSASPKKWHPNLIYLKECQIFLLHRAVANTWLEVAGWTDQKQIKGRASRLEITVPQNWPHASCLCWHQGFPGILEV